MPVRMHGKRINLLHRMRSQQLNARSERMILDDLEEVFKNKKIDN